MLPFGVTIPATVPQGSEIPEGLMNNPVLRSKIFFNSLLIYLWSFKKWRGFQRIAKQM
jgi:hypothetical protein